MPNSANKSKNSGSNAGQGQPKHDSARASDPKPNPERSDVKHNTGNNDSGDSTSRSSNQGRKSASGGSAED